MIEKHFWLLFLLLIPVFVGFSSTYLLLKFCYPVPILKRFEISFLVALAVVVVLLLLGGREIISLLQK